MEQPKEGKIKFSSFLIGQTLVLGLLFAADSFFGFFEQQFFNTYIAHVLFLPELYIAIMVSLSAVMGLIFCLVWGIKSDNTRTRWGKRRPYLILGGMGAGIAMILYAFSPNYWWCLFFDVIVIGVASNAYFAASRALIPDTFPSELRGRANGIIAIFSNLAILMALAVFLISYELFAIPNPKGSGTILTQEGHLFVLAAGGIFFALCGILGFILVREMPTSEMPPKKKFIPEFKEIFDLKEVRKQKQFFKMVGAYIIFKTGVYIVLTYLFLFIFALGLRTLELLAGIGIAFILLIFAILAMGKISDKVGRKKFVPLFIIIACFGFFLMPFTKPFEFSDVNLLIFYIALPFVVIGILGLPVPLDAWSQDLLPEDRRGKFLGIYNLMWIVSQIIGSFVGAFVAMIFGIAWIFLAGAIFMIISIPFFMFVKETLNKR